MKRSRVYITAALLAASLPALAHMGMHGPGSQYDWDGSGALSLEEFKHYLADTKQDMKQADARFKSLDANHDGKLTTDEFIKGLPEYNDK